MEISFTIIRSRSKNNRNFVHDNQFDEQNKSSWNTFLFVLHPRDAHIYGNFLLIFLLKRMLLMDERYETLVLRASTRAITFECTITLQYVTVLWQNKTNAIKSLHKFTMTCRLTANLNWKYLTLISFFWKKDRVPRKK